MTTLWHQQWVTDPDDKILLQLFVTGQGITTITASVRSPPQISFGREKQCQVTMHQNVCNETTSSSFITYSVSNTRHSFYFQETNGIKNTPGFLGIHTNHFSDWTVCCPRDDICKDCRRLVWTTSTSSRRKWAQAAHGHIVRQRLKAWLCLALPLMMCYRTPGRRLRSRLPFKSRL